MLRGHQGGASGSTLTTRNKKSSCRAFELPPQRGPHSVRRHRWADICESRYASPCRPVVPSPCRSFPCFMAPFYTLPEKAAMEYGYKKHEKPEEQLPRPHEQIPGRRLRAEGFQMLETHQLRHAHALSVDAQDFVAPQRPPGDSAGQHAQHDADQGKGRCRNQRLSIARARSRVDTGGFS